MHQNTLEEIAGILNKYDNFIISAHIHLDGDALGSELALNLMLNSIGKNVTVVNQDEAPDIYKYLPGVEEIIHTDKFDKDYFLEVKPKTVLVVLDSSNLDRIGNIHIDLKQIEFIINIDHHCSNTIFGKYNYIDSDASSVGEILYRLGKQLNCSLNKEIAISLYTAIITDTGSFRYENTNADTFKIAFDLVKQGASPSSVADNIYNKNEASGLRLLGEALRQLKTDFSSKISWTVVTRDMLKETNSKDEETEGIVDRILSIKNIKVSAFFRETRDGYIKVSFRSKGDFNVDKFARLFSGGGHPNAAGCNIKGTIHDVTNLVISRLQTEINKK
jgi:bifunctional oligoribonuclease and PAP phosphatase NrnA